MTPAARALEVDRKTVMTACATGTLTRRMMQVLERWLWSEDHGVRVRQGREMRGLVQRLDAQEARVAGLERQLGEGGEAGRGPAAAGETRAGPPRPGEGSPGWGEDGRRRPASPEGDALSGPAIRELVVTAQAGDGDPARYGAAWPLVAEWRRRRAGHPPEGKTLAWLARQAAVLELELVLLETFGMTLPPEREPLRGFARRGQLTWRRTALANTRRRRARRELLRWWRRVLTLGIWWR